MNTVHMYDFDGDNVILGARAAKYLDEDDSKNDALLHYGDTVRVYAWRTTTGNISVRLIE